MSWLTTSPVKGEAYVCGWPLDQNKSSNSTKTRYNRAMENVMNPLNANHIAAIRSEMKGAWLKKFDESIQVINDSLAQGSWVTRGAVKASAGFGQGTGIVVPTCNPSIPTGNMITTPHGTYPERVDNPAWPYYCTLGHCLRFGGPVRTDDLEGALTWLEGLKNGKGKLVIGKHTMGFVRAWIALNEEVENVKDALNEARPAPVKTAIGLSPKVTATLKEMNLDINLPSIECAEIAFYFVPKRDKEGKIMMSRNEKASLLDRSYYVKWTPGTKFGRSRFGGKSHHCEACGKAIHSGQFVAIECDDQNSGDHLGLWIGRDCAANIFGVKDAGVERK